MGNKPSSGSDSLPHPDQLNAYFDAQSQWLKWEGDAERDRLAARRQAASRDKAERRGETLLRMHLNDHSTGLGGRFLLDFVKPGHTALPMNRLKVGSPVVISDDRDESDTGITGVVSRRKSHLIQVATEVFPSGDRHRIDLSPDETTRRRQEAAMAQMRSATGSVATLRDRVMGRLPIREASSNPPSIESLQNLNPPQMDAVQFALASPDLAVLHGPPGTGKTTTLAEIIYQSVRRGQRVLACAPSNTGVDNLLEKLARMLPDVVRIGHPARVFESLRDHTLDQRVLDDRSQEVLDDMRRELEYLIRAASKDYRSNDGRRRRGQLYAEAGKLRGQIRALERSIIQGVLDSADVLCTTTTLDDDLLGDRMFDLVAIDEACQCTLPGVWQAVLRAKRLVLAGDHLQLPPTVISDRAAKAGLSESLMQRLVDREGDRVYRRLSVQYRMHQDIMRFSSDHFYDGSLVADASVRDRRLCDLPGVATTPRSQCVLEMIDTAGAEFDEQLESEGLSKFNPKEANVVVTRVGELLDAGVDSDQIAIIAPYGAQVRQLRNRIDLRNIEIDTVDGFQGREKEVVIISMVRSNPQREIGFLSEVRRTNVAMTRAKRQLIVVGDSATLGGHEFYAAMLEYFEQHGEYRSVWELDLP
ncbi:MAG: IGHMBP2 family helicase [Planctomycetota bacterium]